MRKSPALLFGTLCVVLLSVSGKPGPQFKGRSITETIAPALVSAKADAAYGKMPLYFIPNQGQLDKQVAYYVQGKDKTIYFTEDGITLALTKAPAHSEVSGFPRRNTTLPPGAEGGAERWVVKLDFVGANPDVEPVGQDETGGVISYFKGNPEEWRTGLPTYSKIVYPGLWPGIDLVYHGTVNRLKYEFIVHPGADPSKIRLAYRGAESVFVDKDGRLQISTPAGGFSDDVPLAYQEVRGDRVGVPLAYKLGAADEMNEHDDLNRAMDDSAKENPGKSAQFYGFEVGAYDHAQTLVLDPAILAYCGYIGGSGSDSGRGIAVDGSGNAYVTGSTSSTEATFPVAVGPDLTQNGGNDAFVAKVNAAGTGLVYCGYIGGSGAGGDYGNGIAVDGSGNAYVTGESYSTEATFPVAVGPDLVSNGGSDAFVAKVNAAGTGLVYCGYIGGSVRDYGNGIAVDGSGNAYVTGDTASTEATFPVAVGPDLVSNFGSDAFVAKVNAAGTGLVYCGYIGGSSNDHGCGIAVDGSGNAYVTGDTGSREATFPVAVGPDLTHNGGGELYDAFVAKVNAAGTGLVYCGYIGGCGSGVGVSGNDYGRGIAVDGSGNAYVTGDTSSTEASFPVAGGPDLVSNGVTDAFVAKVYPGGTSLAYCGYIGGSGYDYGNGIAVDGSGNAYVTGYTGSTEATFPVAVGPDLVSNGLTDAFVAKVNAAGTGLVYCGYIGSSGSDYGRGIAVDGSGNAYVTGDTLSAEANFPVAVGPDLTYNSATDAFVAKINYLEQPVQNMPSGISTETGRTSSRSISARAVLICGMPGSGASSQPIIRRIWSPSTSTGTGTKRSPRTSAPWGCGRGTAAPGTS